MLQRAYYTVHAAYRNGRLSEIKCTVVNLRFLWASWCFLFAQLRACSLWLYSNHCKHFYYYHYYPEPTFCPWACPSFFLLTTLLKNICSGVGKSVQLANYSKYFWCMSSWLGDLKRATLHKCLSTYGMNWTPCWEAAYFLIIRAIINTTARFDYSTLEHSIMVSFHTKHSILSPGWKINAPSLLVRRCYRVCFFAFFAWRTLM